MTQATVAMLSAMIAFPAFAQSTPPQPAAQQPCFEILVLPVDPRSDAPAVALRIDRCTGEAWTLERDLIRGPHGNHVGYFWVSIPVAARRE